MKGAKVLGLDCKGAQGLTATLWTSKCSDTGIDVELNNHS